MEAQDRVHLVVFLAANAVEVAVGEGEAAQRPAFAHALLKKLYRPENGWLGVCRVAGELAERSDSACHFSPRSADRTDETDARGSSGTGNGVDRRWMRMVGEIGGVG